LWSMRLRAKRLCLSKSKEERKKGEMEKSI
jgi:hypothetical protein